MAAAEGQGIPEQEPEIFPLVDPQGQVIGSAAREECHGNPALLHPVVHCIVRDRQGRWLLQLRSVKKDIQPGKWDTSVGGHIRYGETPQEALEREVGEEIGLVVRAADCRFLHQYTHANSRESELVYTYTCTRDGPFTPQESEVDAVRFWTVAEIQARLPEGIFTPNFAEEFALSLPTL